MSYLKRRKNAFTYAISGLWNAFKREVHLKLFLIIAFVVIGFGLYFTISKREWFAIGLCITLVLCLELVNSALEKLCDMLMPDRDPKIKYIKDVMAGAVLLACIFAAVTGISIFWTYLF